MAPPITHISPDVSLAEIDKFDTIIDVRSPAEFADDHIPGAINLPVLDDQQRAEIGTIHKQINPFSAKRTGAAFVAQNIASHLQTTLQDKARDWRLPSGAAVNAVARWHKFLAILAGIAVLSMAATNLIVVMRWIAPTFTETIVASLYLAKPERRKHILRAASQKARRLLI